MRYPVLVSQLSSSTRQFSTVTSAAFRNLSFAISGGDGRKFSSLTDSRIPRDSGHLLLGVARPGLPSFPQTGYGSVHSLRSWCFDVRLADPGIPRFTKYGDVRDCTNTTSSSPNGVYVDPHPGRCRRYESCTSLLPIFTQPLCPLLVAHPSSAIHLDWYLDQL